MGQPTEILKEYGGIVEDCRKQLSDIVSSINSGKSSFQKYYEHLQRMKEEGLEDFKVSRYNLEESEFDKEVFAQNILDFLNAPDVPHVPGLFKDEKPEFVRTF